MQLKLFVLPIKNLAAPEAEMNAFLRGHRVLAVKKEFVADGENSFWSFCVNRSIVSRFIFAFALMGS